MNINFVITERFEERRQDVAGIPFRRFLDVSVIAAVGQGLVPSLSLYALRVLGMSAGFAVALSGVAAAGALAGSLVTGSFLLVGSSSRVLRASFGLRTVAAVCCAAAIPANPFAPVFLLVGSALFNGAGNAGALASNERMYRLAPPDARVHCQSRFVGATALGVGAGSVVTAAALALASPAAWFAYTALFAGSAISRATATVRTEVSASWSSPPAPAAGPGETPAAEVPAAELTAPEPPAGLPVAKPAEAPAAEPPPADPLPRQ